jgi:hypothetical protein
MDGLAWVGEAGGWQFAVNEDETRGWWEVRVIKDGTRHRRVAQFTDLCLRDAAMACAELAARMSDLSVRRWVVPWQPFIERQAWDAVINDSLDGDWWGNEHLRAMRVLGLRCGGWVQRGKWGVDFVPLGDWLRKVAGEG